MKRVKSFLGLSATLFAAMLLLAGAVAIAQNISLGPTIMKGPGIMTFAQGTGVGTRIQTHMTLNNTTDTGIDFGNTTFFITAGGCGGSSTGNPICYSSTAESIVQTPIGVACTAYNLSLRTGSGSGTTRTITLMKNGVATSLTTNSSSANAVVEDTTHTATYAATDLIDFQMVGGAASGATVTAVSVWCH